MKKHNINSKGEADHISTRYYLADEVDLQLDAMRQALRCLLVVIGNNTGEEIQCDRLTEQHWILQAKELLESE